MPELPEVETIVRELRQRVLNRRMKGAVLLRPSMSKSSGGAAEFDEMFKGRSFISVERRGKFILIGLDDGKRLLFHLGMTGKFIVSDGHQAEVNHLCSQYLFAERGRLDHVDVRRFGRLEVYRAGQEIPTLEKLGMDPLSPQFGPDALKKLVFSKNGRAARRRAVHPLLLDQTLISGVGNIYASEALFRARIRPDRQGGTLKSRDLTHLAIELKNVLAEALQRGGTTVSDYRRIDDKPGEFRSLLKVYGRQGEPCLQCKTAIRRLRLNGRSAFFCPKCQR